MHIAVQESRAVLGQAVRALTAGAADAYAAVHAARAFIPPQAQRVTQEAVQLHGGIGITEEYAVSHCLRRALVDERWFGSSHDHLQRFAAQALTR